MKKFSPAFLFFFLVSISVNAQLELVKDINLLINGSSSNPSNLTEWNGSLYFSANDGTHGTELWKTDSTAEGAVLVKDIQVGQGNSSPFGFIVFNDALYFLANDGVNGLELWKTDGTAQGTVLVKDIFAGASSGGSPVGLTIFDGALYFLGNDGTHGQELWKSNGTADGTMMVKDIFAGASGSTGTYTGLTTFNGFLYFQANDGVNGNELWKTDGSVNNTVMVKDIFGGLSGSNPSQFKVFNGAMYFGANDGISGIELWKTDGTLGGTVLVKDIFSGSGSNIITQFTVFNGSLFFRANDGVTGFELWKTNGTADSTILVKDIFVGTNNSSAPLQLFVFNGALYFSATNGTNGAELYRTNGTAEGTVLVKHIISPAEFTILNGELFFRSGASSLDQELWKTDGTTEGTVLVKDILSGNIGSSPSGFTVVNGLLYFRANDGLVGNEIWRSDGTANGTELVKDIVSATSSSSPQQLTSFNGAIYFQANDGVNGFELWKSNGTEAGSVLVKDIFIGLSGSNPGQFATFNGNLYFNANDGVNGQELWKTNGTEAGTTLVKDIFIGGSGGGPNQFATFNGNLYFRANDGVNGIELWKTDGTAAGTVLVKDILVGGGNSAPLQLTEFNGALYFSAFDGVNGQELWKTDGTTAGTVLVKDIVSGGGGSNLNFFTVSNGVLYFTANDGINGQELWKTNGTAAGTVLVKDILNGANGSSISQLTNFNGALYFIANDGVHGTELWKSDGTEVGTVLIKDIYNGFGNGVVSSSLSPFTTFNGALYFAGDNGISGIELWKTDGTAIGTILVKELVVGGGGGGPSTFTVRGNALYFLANGGNLWKTQGSACNTIIVANGQLFAPIVASGQNLYGTSPNPLYGIELHKYNTSNDPVINCTPTVQASNIVVSNTLADQATISFTKGNGNHRAVLMLELYGRIAACAGNGQNILLNGNSNFSSNTSFCLSGIQYNLVYADTGNVVHVTGLLPDHDYKVLVLEYNRDTGTDYLLTAGAPVDTMSTIIAPNVYVTSPANGAVNQKTKLNITTKSVTGATTYTIEISTDSEFNSNVISKSGGRTQSFDSLSYGTEYFTRVKTNLRPDYGTSTSFTTIVAEQLAYVITPKNLAINQKVALSVTSNIVPLATEYTIELNTLENFTGESIVQTGGKTQMFDSLKYGTTYYTRVKTELSENWGATRSFTTLDAASISYVITPKDAAVNQKVSLNVTANLVPNATEYTIELNTLENFSGASIVQTGGRTQLFSGLQYNTIYFSRVRTEFTESWGAIRSFKTIDAADLSYVTAPANNAINVNTTLNISSYTVPGATLYTIQLSEFSDFRTINFEKSGPTRTQAFTGLKYNTPYYNRVRTNLSAQDNCSVICDAVGADCFANAAGDPDIIILCQSQYVECKAACPINVGWGVVRSFTTRTAESLAYVTSPANGSVDRKTNLNISSNTVAGASSYTIQLSEDSVFSEIAFEVTGPTKTLAFSGLNGGTKYYNRVTTNAPGTIGFGQKRSFTTIGVPPGARLSSPTPGDQIESEELQVETEELKEFEVHVYPNPFREKLIFHIEARVAQQANVILLDVNGKAVHESIEQTNTNVEIDKPLAVGVYLLRITAGTQYKMIRVVKSE